MVSEISKFLNGLSYQTWLLCLLFTYFRIQRFKKTLELGVTSQVCFALLPCFIQVGQPWQMLVKSTQEGLQEVSRYKTCKLDTSLLGVDTKQKIIHAEEQFAHPCLNTGHVKWKDKHRWMKCRQHILSRTKGIILDIRSYLYSYEPGSGSCVSIALLLLRCKIDTIFQLRDEGLPWQT